MATRTVTGVIKKPNGTAWAGGRVVFRLKPDTFRSTPAETYPEDVVIATSDASGNIGVTLISGTGLLYEVTLPSGDQFTIDLPDGSATTIEAQRASFSGAPVSSNSVNDALIALYGSAPIGRPALAVQRNDVTITAEAATIDFSTKFSVSDSPAGESNVDLTATLDDLTDVAITSPLANQGVFYTGSQWVNRRPPSTIVTLFAPSATAGDMTWANMPAAVTGFLGNTNSTFEFRADTQFATEYRLTVRVASPAGATGAELFLEYWTGSAWADAASTAGAGDVLIDTATTTVTAAFTAFVAAAKAASALFRLAGKGGDGVVDPAFGLITLEFR